MYYNLALFFGGIMDKANLKFEFMKYVSFNVIGMIGLSCYILADTFFIAQGVGSNGLTSLNIAIPVYSFINGVGLMIGMGGATRFSISNSKNIFTHSIYYAIMSASFFLILGLFFSEHIATLIGANADVFFDTNIYIKTILCFSPMFLLNNVILCYVRNDGAPKLSMIAMLAGSFSNILLDYLFIFPMKLGMFGAAIATGIAPIISLLILSIYFIKKQNTFTLKKVSINGKKLFDISSLGISALITEFSSGIVIIVFNILILNIAGNIGVAAYGIIANISLVILAIFTAISQGSQPIISRYYGQGNIKDTKKIMLYGVLTSISIAILIYILSIVFADSIISAFNRDSDVELAKIAKNGLYIYFTSFIFAGANIVIATYFSSIDIPKNAFISSFLRGFALVIPLAIILSMIFGINGVWLTVPVTEVIVFIISFIMLLKIQR